MRDMNTVPERWYEAPQRPKRTARPERPAAAIKKVRNTIGWTDLGERNSPIGCKMRVKVRL